MDEGLQYIRKNALKGCKCRMDEPFMFISYSHDDKEIVQDWFLKLYRLGYNLWIDVANLPHNQQSWEDAAEDALLSGNCVRLLFFRSENSMKSVNIYEELNKANARLPKLDITIIDIWREPEVNASNFLNSYLPKIQVADEGGKALLRAQRDISRKIFRIASAEANAVQDGIAGLVEVFQDVEFPPTQASQTPAAEVSAPEAPSSEAPAPVKRGRGRPAGSKNKPKTPAPAQPAPVVATPAAVPAPEKDVSLTAVFGKVLAEFVPLKTRQEPIKGHPMYFYFQDEIPHLLLRTGLVDAQRYHTAASAGKGMWSAVPWIGIFDRQITTSAQRGVYIVYLFSADGESLYLTLNQGCTDLTREYGGREANRRMKENTARIRAALDARGFAADDGAVLGDHLPPLAQGYQNGVIFYKHYDKSALPPEDSLRQDLADMLRIYQEYAAHFLP